MDFEIKWLDTNDVYLSDCETVTVCRDMEGWLVDDHIDGDQLRFESKLEALDTGGMRILITRMGNFYPIIKSMYDTSDVHLDHQFI